MRINPLNKLKCTCFCNPNQPHLCCINCILQCYVSSLHVSCECEMVCDILNHKLLLIQLDTNLLDTCRWLPFTKLFVGGTSPSCERIRTDVLKNAVKDLHTLALFFPIIAGDISLARHPNALRCAIFHLQAITWGIHCKYKPPKQNHTYEGISNYINENENVPFDGGKSPI